MIHTGYEDCPVRPLHDPCHAGLAGSSLEMDDMTARSVLNAWRRAVRGTASGHELAGIEITMAATGRQVERIAGGPGHSRERDVGKILAAIRVVDAHLDANTAQAYRDQPLAGHWSRITKPLDEAMEAKEALAGVTGENPRKGVCDTWEHVLEELGDTACAALLGIQHVTKDTDATWAVFLAALAKALSRVPQERPA